MAEHTKAEPLEESLAALAPRGDGHQFILYGDACSGVRGAPHETTFARINKVVKRLSPTPEFVIFPGDEIIGLTADEAHLRDQWRHWFEVETAWLDRARTPMWHSTGNHTTYDEMSEAVFRELLGMPRNGPPGQQGLSYFVRRGELLLVFVHTLCTSLGGEGHVDVDWLDTVLRSHPDARWKLVVGHHPVHSVNGFSGPYVRDIGPEHGVTMWNILVENGVIAYVCSHILAFDVQVHRGVLQICTAGAGTAHRMPEGIEYLHCVQAALDHSGIRYQVIDDFGMRRESLSWPLPDTTNFTVLALGAQPAPFQGSMPVNSLIDLRVSGATVPAGCSAIQTIFSAESPNQLPAIWIGFRGKDQRLTAIVARTIGRSPHYWSGPALAAGAPFHLQLRLSPAMGPGGLMWRMGAEQPWSSLIGSGATGLENTIWPAHWHVGSRPHGEKFKGDALVVAWGLQAFDV